MDESCHILISHKWVMWHAWISYVTHVNESCHIIMEERYFICHTRHNRKCFTLHMSRGHATYLNELCQKCKVTLFYLSRMLHNSYINGRCRVLCTPTLTKRVFIYARVFMCVIQIMHRYHELGPFICHNPMNVFCHIIHASSQMQHYSPYKWHDSYLYVTCLPGDICDMNRLLYDMTHVIPVPWLTSYMPWLI